MFSTRFISTPGVARCGHLEMVSTFSQNSFAWATRVESHVSTFDTFLFFFPLFLLDFSLCLMLLMNFDLSVCFNFPPFCWNCARFGSCCRFPSFSQRQPFWMSIQPWNRVQLEPSSQISLWLIQQQQQKKGKEKEKKKKEKKERKNRENDEEVYSIIWPRGGGRSQGRSDQSILSGSSIIYSAFPLLPCVRHVIHNKKREEKGTGGKGGGAGRGGGGRCH